MLDGVSDEIAYLNAHPKIIYLLKEVNDGQNWDLREFIFNGGRARTWNNIARWTYGIQMVYNGVNTNTIKWEDLLDIEEAFRIKYLRSIAAVNLKKQSGSCVANNKQIKTFAEEDKDLLVQQISIYNADIIICCGVNYPNAGNITWKATSRGIYYAYQGTSIIINFVHPEVRCAANYTFYALIDAVQEIFFSHS